MIALDTNVLVRLVVEDDAEQTALALRLLDRALADRALLFVPSLVLCELVWVLRSAYRFPQVMVADAVGWLLAAEQIHVENHDETERAFAAFEAGEGDVADLLLRERARTHGAQAVATFDRALHRAHGFVSPDPATWGDDLSLHEDIPRYRRRRRPLPVR